MVMKFYKPDTPSKRSLALVSKEDLWKGRPEKSLTKGISSKAGRNNQGRITCRHKGGGHKRLYRDIDFKRNKFDVYAEVVRIEYDPNRNAHIALIKYDDGELSYIIAPNKIKIGAKIVSSKNADIQIGNVLPLSSIPTGVLLHNIEIKSGKGAQICRAAGTYAQLVGKDSGRALLRLRSGEVRYVDIKCLATVGSVSNPDFQNQNLGKAGRKRWLGVRPTVRGVAMNPVDHPHGGGEGRTSGGRHPVSPWGKPTKGKRTRSKKKSNVFIAKSRHNVKGRR